MSTFVIEIRERDGAFLGRCREQGWGGPVGFSGVRTTENAAAKRALGNYFHVRDVVGKPGGEEQDA